MFPIRDDNPTLGTSIVTMVLIGLNVASWVLLQGLGTNPMLAASVCVYGAIPGELLGLVPIGTQVPLGEGLACTIGEPSWGTTLSSMFMHGSWFHLLDNVEDAMGPVRFVLFYLLSGLAAVAAQVASNPDSAIPMVGASGAIGGVMGAYAFLYPRARVHMLVILGFWIDRIPVPAALMLGYWFLLQILGGLPALAAEGGGVAFWAHAGGFLAGIGLMFLLRKPERLAAHRRMMARRGLA